MTSPIPNSRRPASRAPSRRPFAALACALAAFAVAPVPASPAADVPAAKVPAGRPAEKPSAFVVKVFRGHTDGVLAVAITADGKLVASAGADRTARVWDAAAGRELHTLTGHTAAVTLAEFSADGKRLVTGGVDHTARVWDAAKGDLLAVLQGHGSHVHCLAVSGDGKTVVTGSCDGTVRVWDADAEKERLTIRPGVEPRAVALSPDGRVVAVGVGGTAGDPRPAAPPAVQFYSARDGTLAKAVSPPAVPWALAYIPDGSAVRYAAHQDLAAESVLGSYDAKTYAAGKEIAYKGSADRVLVSADGGRAVSYELRLVSCWRPADRSVVRDWRAAGPEVNAAALTPDGRYVVTGSGGRGDPYGRGGEGWAAAGTNDVCLCDLGADAPAAATVPLPAGVTVGHAAVAPAGGLAAVRLSDKTVRLIDLAAGKARGEFPTLPGPLFPAFSHDGRRLAVVRPKGVTVYDTATAEPAGQWDSPGGDPVWSVALTPDGAAVAVATSPAAHRDGKTLKDVMQVRLIDVKIGTEVRSLKSPGLVPRRLFASADGRWLAAWDTDQSFRGPPDLPVFDLRTGAEASRVKPDGKFLRDVQFAPDGRLYTNMNGNLSLWDPATGNRSLRFDPPTDALSSAAFSPDGKTLFAQCDDGAANFWDTATGRRTPVGGTYVQARGNGRNLAAAFLPAGGASGGGPGLLLSGSEAAQVIVVPGPPPAAR